MCKKKLLTIKEYAELTQQHPQTVYQRIKLKQIKACFFGRNIRIPITEIDAVDEDIDYEKILNENKVLNEKVERYEKLIRDISLKLLSVNQG